MTIFPDGYRIFRDIENNRTITKIYLYSQDELLYSGEIVNITSEKFKRLQIFLEVLVKINKDANPTKIGIVEVQWFLRGFM